LTASDYSNNRTLSQAPVGDLLIADLRCATCHASRDDSGFPERAATDISEVGARLAPDCLRRFLESPSSTHPGTLMPDMLTSFSDTKRNEIAKALTHFLFSQSKNGFQPVSIDKSQPGLGKELFHSIGCVACHAPRELIEIELPEDDENDEKNANEKRSSSPLACNWHTCPRSTVIHR